MDFLVPHIMNLFCLLWMMSLIVIIKEVSTLCLLFINKINFVQGSILACSRGGFELDKIISFLAEKKINQLYVIGGDGTHRAANKIAEECIQRKLNIVVVGIPKTIDNDVSCLLQFNSHQQFNMMLGWCYWSIFWVHNLRRDCSSCHY